MRDDDNVPYMMEGGGRRRGQFTSLLSLTILFHGNPICLFDDVGKVGRKEGEMTRGKLEISAGGGGKWVKRGGFLSN